MRDDVNIDTISPLETIINKWWTCLSKEEGDKGIIIRPFLVIDEDKGLNVAFERFASDTSQYPDSLPLFLTLPNQSLPCGFPSEFVLSIFELEELPHRIAELKKITKSKWWLLDQFFPLSFAWFWLGQSTQPKDCPIDNERHKRIERRKDALGLGQQASITPNAEWNSLVTKTGTKGQTVDPLTAIDSLDGLLELSGRPSILFLDDLAGRSDGLAKTAHLKWKAKLDEFRKIFTVATPILPVQEHHAEHPDELLPIIRTEIARLPRPLAAVVDMNWLYADTGERNPLFGLELIRLIHQAKPTLPVFVWSPINDKQTLQRIMQLGAANFFDKEQELSFGHETATEDNKTKNTDSNRYLTPSKLWFHILEWENARYRMPPVQRSGGSFLLDETRESKDARNKFLKIFNLTEGDLLAEHEPDVELLLRALVPEAAHIEIVRFFGEGMSSSEPPFVVRGKTRTGQWLRPVQIKISRDWRALARESKGYRDVFAGALGPSVAHIESGPYRIGEWCGLCQSFAAPEEAIRDIGNKHTRSLCDWLEESLSEPAVCKSLVDELFDGVLDPFYKGNLTTNWESVVRAFDRVTPAHLETTLLAVPDSVLLEAGAKKKRNAENEIDLTPDHLSMKNVKVAREMAYREWQKAETWFRNGTTDDFYVYGLVIDTLEPNHVTPSESRLRLLDRTLGVKVDLTAGNADVARRWLALAKSPIKLRGLPVSFRLNRTKLKNQLGANSCLLGGWTISVNKKLSDGGITLPEFFGSRIGSYFYPCHPLDWTEEFHVGPTHGDLNLGNILLHKKESSYFPWLIDFDKAENNRPVVFDLAKLEIEAYHKIVQDLYWELQQLGCTTSDGDSTILQLFMDFERCLESTSIQSVAHLWERFEGKQAVPDSLKMRFAGCFSYLKQVHARVAKLDIDRLEFLVGRAIYCFSCLKFKHLYNAKTHQNAPFPAQVLLWKLQALQTALDAENGILHANVPVDSRTNQQKVITDILTIVRAANWDPNHPPLHEVVVSSTPPFGAAHLSAVLALPSHKGTDKPKPSLDWETVFRLLRDHQIPGKGRWFRELLWYARVYGIVKDSKDLAIFTVAMVRASMKPYAPIILDPRLHDFASTGRPGNDYPSLKMLEQLSDKTNPPFVKMSTRGDSGGTIDILEQAGIPLCKSLEAISHELNTRGWALATTSDDLCEIDQILWRLRKQTNCMKVDDLVIASISAKKVAVGIGSFAVQIVSGYDSKFSSLLKSADTIAAIEGRWEAVWSTAYSLLDWPATTDAFKAADPGQGFNSDSLLSWTTTKAPRVVFGTALLAANLWKENPLLHSPLRMRMPQAFCKTMEELTSVLSLLDTIAAKEMRAAAPDDEKIRIKSDIVHLSCVDSLAHLKGVRCFRTHSLDKSFEALRDIAVVMFTFPEDIVHHVRVPVFDELYSLIAKSGNPMASIVFTKHWIAILRPKTEIDLDLHTWCWNLLRDGFEDHSLCHRPPQIPSTQK